MAVLSDTERRGIWSRLMKEESRYRNSVGINKSDLRAAIDATDDWIDSNESNFNAQLPQPAKSALTARQKAMMFMYVAARRYEVL